MIDLESLYPELVGFDGLPFVLQSKLSELVPDSKIQSGISFSKWREMKDVFERQGLYHSPTTVATQIGAWANVDIAIEQKLYILTLGNKNGKASAFIEVDSLDKAITFLSVWLSNEKQISQLNNIEHFTTFLNLEDDIQYIRWQWASCHRNAVNFPALTGLLVPLFYQAMQDSVLSQVTPYTSLATLCLSRCTEYPFLADDYPIASPAYYIGQHYRYVAQKRDLEEAERLILQLPSEVGNVAKLTSRKYELTNAQGEHIFKGEPIELLEFIIDYTNGRYDVTDRKGNGLTAQNAKEAVEFLRNALPVNGYPSVRGSADEINL